MRFAPFTLALLFVQSVQCQPLDTLFQINGNQRPAQIFLLHSQTYIYPKPKALTFITSIPKTFTRVAKQSFHRKSIKPWIWIAGSTVALWAADQKIMDGMQQFSRHINLDYSRKYIDVVGFNLGNKYIDVYQAPNNLNTAIYTLGEGVPPLLIGAGLFAHGLIKNNYRSLSTASQLMQGLIAMGITTQFLKRTTGRESPFKATQDRGRWRPFPNPKTYQQNVSSYDAFPSGHMGTMMVTTVILAENYPEKKWIRPVGYSIMGLVGLSMINNNVHWTSDYPLAIGMGYVFGKVTVNMNRWIRHDDKNKR